MPLSIHFSLWPFSLQPVSSVLLFFTSSCVEEGRRLLRRISLLDGPIQFPIFTGGIKLGTSPPRSEAMGHNRFDLLRFSALASRSCSPGYEPACANWAKSGESDRFSSYLLPNRRSGVQCLQLACGELLVGLFHRPSYAAHFFQIIYENWVDLLGHLE